MFLLGKIKTFVIAGLAVLLPILYLFGRRDGAKAQQQADLADDLQTSEKVSDFYKAMAEHEVSFTPTNRSDLIERLRRDGL